MVRGICNCKMNYTWIIVYICVCKIYIICTSPCSCSRAWHDSNELRMGQFLLRKVTILEGAIKIDGENKMPQLGTKKVVTQMDADSLEKMGKLVFMTSGPQ